MILAICVQNTCVIWILYKIICLLQPEGLIYHPTDQEFVLNLQDKIERQLKDRVMEWRPRHITRWNRYCMQAFRSLLARLVSNTRHKEGGVLLVSDDEWDRKDATNDVSDFAVSGGHSFYLLLNWSGLLILCGRCFNT